jgi:uncharacterized DUF497 family protein
MWDWDETKRQANLAKHGVDFAVADGLDLASAISEPDTRHDYGEPRFVVTGTIGGRLHIMVYTPRGKRLRIISLRKANGREEARWERLKS